MEGRLLVVVHEPLGTIQGFTHFESRRRTCMADPRQSRATEEDMHLADRPAYPGTPRWVKVTGIIVIVLVLLVGIILVTGVGGEHGPGRHIPSGGAGGYTLPIAHEVQSP